MGSGDFEIVGFDWSYQSWIWKWYFVRTQCNAIEVYSEMWRALKPLIIYRTCTEHISYSVLKRTNAYDVEGYTNAPIRAQLLTSYFHHALLSPIAHLLPPSYAFMPDRSSLTLTASIQVQLLISHLHCVLSSPNTCFLLPPGQFKPKCSSSASTMFI